MHVDRDQLQVGLGYGSFDTTIRFDDDRDVDMEMTTVSLSAAWLINESWTVRAGVGMILDGTLQQGDAPAHTVEPGGLAALGLEYRALAGEGMRPFVDLSFFVGTSWTETVTPGTSSKVSYKAGDARLGARAGWNVRRRAFPYVAARVFGGPVQWELAGDDVTGTDIHHYQIAMGTASQVGPVSVYAEWAGLGEKALSVGLSSSF